MFNKLKSRIGKGLALAFVLISMFVAFLPAQGTKGLVFDIPDEDGVIVPISYEFELEARDQLVFSFSSNVTMNVTLNYDTTNISAKEWSVEMTKDKAWVFNITLKMVGGVAGDKIDFYAKYTIRRYSGIVMSIIVAICAAAMGVVFSYLLVTRGRINPEDENARREDK